MKENQHCTPDNLFAIVSLSASQGWPHYYTSWYFLYLKNFSTSKCDFTDSFPSFPTRYDLGIVKQTRYNPGISKQTTYISNTLNQPIYAAFIFKIFRLRRPMDNNPYVIVSASTKTHLVEFMSLTQSFQFPFGFLLIIGCKRFIRVWQAS